MLDVNDKRLIENKEVLQWFEDWQKDVPSNNFITRECFEDLKSMVIGIQRLVEVKLKNHPLANIHLNRVNSDVVENVFSSQRGICNGSNTNPTYLQFCKGTNAILIGQNLISKKANAKGGATVGGILPFKFYSKQSFRTIRC